MKSLKRLCVTCALFAATLFPAHAWWAQGFLFCDANQNQQFDGTDTPVPGILVVVTNTSGTFSNANWTTTPEGFFIVQLPDSPDAYVMFLHPATLPPNSGVLLPASATYSFTLTTNIDTFTGNFLISNPLCQEAAAGCWLTGGGTISSRARPAHSFGGNVFPSCSSAPGQGGQWTHVAHHLRLQFQGTVVETVTCGNVQGIPPGSTSPVTPYNFIEFQGTGRLRGINGNRANFSEVLFYARAEDRGEPGSRGAQAFPAPDRYYLRVYDASGTTLLLVSGDTANPTNIVTIPITTGNLQMHSSSCP